jgi:hypothetical protein
MRRSILRWRNRGGRRVVVELAFDDIMAFALALLSLSPDELERLGWSFADRKRFLDRFLASGKAAQSTSTAELGSKVIPLRLPARQAERLQHFARRDLPKAATDAAMLRRVDEALARALGPKS